MKDGMGQGLFIFPMNGKKAYGHGGAIDGFQSNLAYFPEQKIAVAACANGVEYPMNDVMIGVLSCTFGMPHDLPTFEHVEVDAALLKKYAGTYASDQMPLKITISVDGKRLSAQATGQPAFKLTTVGDQEFKFDTAKIKMKFVKNEAGDDYEMEFNQGPLALTFTKSD